MPINNYTVPQAQIFQQFNSTPSVITAPLRALLIGPQAWLVRYGIASEKILGDLGPYDDADNIAYPWPNLPTGAKVDPSYTQLYIDKAQLEYFDDLIGAGDTVAPVANTLNEVRIADATYGFKANGQAWPRFPLLYDRDVQPGDQVFVRGVVGGQNYSLTTYVLDLLADQIAAVVEEPTADSGNGPTQIASSTVNQIAGVDNCNTLAVSLTTYSALADGFLDDTYTITVIQGSSDGELQTALLKITTASGKDNVLSIAPGELDTFKTVGIRGLQIKFTCTGDSSTSISTDDLVVGQTWQVTVNSAYTALTATSSGTYTGTVDTTYIVTVTRGGMFASLTSPPQITVSSTTGVDTSGPTTVTATGTAYTVGSKGVKITFGAGPTGMRLGDKFYIVVEAAKDGRFGTIVLGHNLPTQLLSATDLDLRLSMIRNINVPADRVGFAPLLNWAQDANDITVNAGIIGYDPTFTNGPGNLVPINVTGGEVFVQYRAWQQTNIGAIGFLDDPSLIATTIGTVTPDNPLAQAVDFALLNSNGTSVGYLAVSDPTDINAWSAAIALCVGRQDIYNLVPLTHDTATLELFEAHVNSQSSPTQGAWRGMFVSPLANTEKAVINQATSTDGKVVLATISATTGTSPTAYTTLTVTSGNSLFRTNNVQPGDQVRYFFTSSFGVVTWTTYTVASVLNEETLLLLTGPDAPNSTPIQVEVWHTNSQAEVAQDLANQAGAYASNRVVASWPDKIGAGGVTFDGYNLCAALAGYCSGVVPQQDLTNAAIAGFDDVSRTTKFFNSDQLNTMAAGGIWIVTQTPTGSVQTRDALTTSTVDADHTSEMLRRNLDSISFYFQAVLAPFIGVANVTPTAISRIQAELVSAINFLKSTGNVALIGPQVIDATIESLQADPLSADTIDATISLQLPRALKYLRCFLVVK